MRHADYQEATGRFVFRTTAGAWTAHLPEDSYTRSFDGAWELWTLCGIWEILSAPLAGGRRWRSGIVADTTDVSPATHICGRCLIVEARRSA